MFVQTQAAPLGDALAMPGGTFRLGGSLPSGFGEAPPAAAANLFSSILLPDAMHLAAGGDGGGDGDGDDSGDSSGAGHGGKRSAEQRAAAVQEKNRRAQKRFRERQVG